MTTLHDRLADLADDAPSTLPDPGIWDRGRRYHRRRRAGTLGIVATALLVLALLGGVTWQRSVPTPAPAPASGSVGLPDRVWEPSPWLPTNDRPGRLVAVTPADRGSWTGKHAGVVGVSAVNGEYAFLDLPDANPGHMDEVALSPDGNHVAYWLTGDTEGTANTSFSSEPVAGVAILDTSTGAVQRQWIPTEHGIEPDLLTWVDSDTVVFEAGQIVAGDDGSEIDQAGWREGPLMAWQLGAKPEPIEAGAATGSDVVAAGHGRLVVVEDSSADTSGRFRVIDLGDRSPDRRVGFPSASFRYGNLMPAALDPTGRRVATVPGDRSPSRVHAGVLGDLRVVPDTRDTWVVLDWLDSDTIVILRRVRDREEGSALYRVSVSTGESRQLVRFPAGSYGAGWQFATDLLHAPSVHAEKPPSPLDPRLVTGLAVAIALAALGGLVLWRRRVRP